MNILCISSFGECGGSEIALLDLISILHGDKAIFLFNGGEVEKILKSQNYNVKVGSNIPVKITQNSKIFDYFKSANNLIKIYFRLSSYIIHNKPKLIITNDLKSLFIFKAVFFKPKYHVHYLHAIIHSNLAGRLNPLVQYVFKSTNNFICNSQYTKKCINSFTNKNNNIVVAYQFFNQPRVMTKNENDGHFFTLGVVSRISRLKNIEIVIAALVDLRLQKLPYVLYIFGNAHTEDDYKYKSELDHLINIYGLNDCVIFMGHVSKKSSIYPRISIFISASQLESFGRVIIEAMTYKIPIIASNIPAHLEIINDGYDGLLFDGTAISLSNKILELYRNPLKRDILIENALKNSIAKYSCDVFSKSVNDFINNDLV